MPRAFCLAIHASWKCRRAGACCRAGWAIPVEGPVFEKLRVHFGRERAFFVTGGPLPEGAAAVLAANEDGTCRFYEGRLCAVHRELGPGVLPVACQQFPRQVLRDARGTFITLSHHCPTAARLLVAGGPLRVVEAPPSLSLNGAVEGLDATDVLPPLLRPGLLMDLDGYAEWERQAIAVLDSDRWDAEEAVGRIAAATRIVVNWQPGGEPLGNAVSAAFESAGLAGVARTMRPAIRRYDLVTRAVPAGLTAPPAPEADELAGLIFHISPAQDRALRTYLAARLFGNWIAYYSPGLLTVVEYLRVCLAVLRVELSREARRSPEGAVEGLLVEAIRQADLLLVHLADARALAAGLQQTSQSR